MIDWESLAKGAGGMGAIGAAVYGAYRMFRNDSRGDKNIETQDGAMQMVIQTLREEVARLAERVATLESQNAKCREENALLSLQILKLQQHVGATTE